MRWPIQVQLLFPMLLVVLVAVSVTTAVASYLEGIWARQQIEAHLRRTVETLTTAYYPLTEGVLEQMSNLTGAEFLLLDAGGRVTESSLENLPEETALLASLPADASLEQFSASPAVNVSGTRYLAGRVQFQRTGVAASLLVLFPEQRWWSASREAAYAPLLAGLLSGMLALVLAAALARGFVRPIMQLKQQAELIASGDFTPVTLTRRNDEIRDLAAAVNEMAARLQQYEEQIRRHERLRTLGTLGAGMAHQLRNWVAGARLAVEHLQGELPADADSESVEIALRQLTLMGTYLQRFLRLGSESAPEFTRVDLAELAEEVVSLVRPACRHASLELELTCLQSPVDINGNTDGLRQLLVNLLLNAVESATRTDSSRGRVTVQLERRQVEGEERVRLEIADSGPGPDKAIAAEIFEPFISNKPDGTGLGLPVAQQVAEQHGGRIAWSRRDEMTCFTTEIPAYQE